MVQRLIFCWESFLPFAFQWPHPIALAKLAYLHIALVESAPSQHQQVGMGIINTQPLLSKSQQLSNTGDVE